MKRFICILVAISTAGTLSARGNADENEIRSAIEKYETAFNSKDLNSLGEAWATNATHIDRETGERTQGRDQIVKDIAESFQLAPQARLSVRVDQVDLIKADVARIEGETSFADGSDEVSISAFTGIVTKQNGTWQIHSIEEMPRPQPESGQIALEELDWLVGRWLDESDEGRVETTVRWSDNNGFLIRSFVSQSVDGEIERGTQIIGWDPRARLIRSWSFNSDGSFGDGIWSKSGDEWLIKSSQTLPDGQAASGTYVLTRVNENAAKLQLIGHEIEGEPQPASPIVTVTRQVDANQPAESQPNSR